MRIIIFSVYCVVFASLWAQQPIDVSPGENTIFDAMMFAYPGDVLQLAEGEYKENQTLVVSMDLTIQGASGAEVIWNVPTSIEDAIHVKGNLHLENIVFKTDPDTTKPDVNCIRNMFGNVTNGNENSVHGNSIFIDHCQFIGFYNTVLIPDARETSIAHPVDTLYVTNSLFYGGSMYKTNHGVQIWHRQARIVKIQDCTFWRFDGEAMHIDGFGYAWDDGRINSDPIGSPDYMTLMIDHCTFYQLGIPPVTSIPGVGIFLEYGNVADTIRNCVFSDIGDFGIKGEWSSTFDSYIDYNLAHPEIGWNCGVCQPWHYNLSNIGSHCQIVNPKFENGNNGDFRYQIGSSALTADSDGGAVGNRIQVWNPGTWDHTPQSGIKHDYASIPQTFVLGQNYPNPFNPATKISYSMPKSGFVWLGIYSASSQKVRSLVNEIKGAGSYSVVWDARDDLGVIVPSGVYFSRLCSGSAVETKKMLFIK